MLAGLLLASLLSAASGTERFIVDPEVSAVRVHLRRAGLLKFLGHDHEIDAPIAAGHIDVDRDDPTRSLVDLHWHAPLLAIVPGTEPEKDIVEVEERMRSPDVLDVSRHERARFWSFEIRVEHAAPEMGRWRLHLLGGLQLKGVRSTVEVPIATQIVGDRLVVTGETVLALRSFGIEPPSVAGVVKVSNEFRVSFRIEAHRLGGPPQSSPADH